MFLKFAGPKWKIHPKSALQNLGLNNYRIFGLEIKDCNPRIAHFLIVAFPEFGRCVCLRMTPMRGSQTGTLETGTLRFSAKRDAHFSEVSEDHLFSPEGSSLFPPFRFLKWRCSKDSPRILKVPVCKVPVCELLTQYQEKALRVRRPFSELFQQVRVNAVFLWYFWIWGGFWGLFTPGSFKRGRCRRGRVKIPHFVRKLQLSAPAPRKKGRKTKKNEEKQKKSEGKQKKRGKFRPTPSAPTPSRTVQLLLFRYPL